VELEERRIVAPEVGSLGRERVRDGAAQMPALPLGDLDLGIRLAGHR
jgi:hypothetical protein